MGKYMRKGKRVGEVAVEVTHASMGVRTRARTLALEQDRKIASSHSMKLQAAPRIDYCYLELRSRKLEKANRLINRSGRSGLGSEKHCSNSLSATEMEGCRSKDSEKAERNYSWKKICHRNDNSMTEDVNCSVNVSGRESFGQGLVRDASFSIEMGVMSVGKVMLRSSSFSSHVQSRLKYRKSFDMSEGNQSISLPLQLEGELAWAAEDANTKVPIGIELEIEASFGDNTMDYECLSANHSCPESGQVRNVREGTPTSNVSRMELAVEAPGSTSRIRANHSFRVAVRSANEGIVLPASHEIDEFFSDTETHTQRSLSKRYNFDFDNDVPLEGRFEWRCISSFKDI